MLGYMMLFLPQAGRSKELIKLCSEHLGISSDRLNDLYSEHLINAQRAMSNYLDRMTRNNPLFSV